MSTLGVISWDFHLLTMRFLYRGKSVFLQGLQLVASSTISNANKFFGGLTRRGLVLQITTTDSVASVPIISSTRVGCLVG